MKRIKLGMRELEIAAELDFQMRVLGAEKPAFETIVAAGPNSALPHAHPGPRRLEPNELLLIDMGATADGYTSDMTRVTFTGTPRPKRSAICTRVCWRRNWRPSTQSRAGLATTKVDGEGSQSTAKVQAGERIRAFYGSWSGARDTRGSTDRKEGQDHATSGNGHHD